MNTPEFQNSGLWPHTGPNLAAEECWTYSRTVNAGNSFDLIYDINNVKRGDVIVIGASPISNVGHIAFADQDYANYSYMMLLGQNQVNPDPNYGHIPTVTWINVGSYFLGAFRYKAWGGGPGPQPFIRRGKFPWFLIARKLRNRY